MNKFLDKFGKDLYDKIGFKKSFTIVLCVLIISPSLSFYFNWRSNVSLESIRFELQKNIADYESKLNKKFEKYKSELKAISDKDFELFIYKKNIYTEVIRVVDKRFDSMNFGDVKQISEEPSTKEMNEAYRQLLLVTDNDEILKRFMKFMDNSINDYCSPANRGDFINLLRIDLGKGEIKIGIDSIPYFRNYKK